ncbi:MAG: polymorphic toxin-type HINT domain-containing protein [Candidatus Saccharibacteria bacterium]
MIIKQTSKSKSSAFTIVELLVVIVVIGVLAAITIVSYTSVSQKAVVASQQSDLNNASKKLEMYKVDNSTYPQTMSETGLNTGLYCPNGPLDPRYCVKPSSGNKLTYSSTLPYTTYTLDATNNGNNSTNYRITNNSSPMLYAIVSTPTAATQGPLSPRTVADDATVGTVAWTNPSDAMVSDDIWVTSGSGTTHYLKATNFGFSVPSGATINGIVVEVERKGWSAAYMVNDVNVKIVKSDGTVGATNRADTLTNWPYSPDEYKSYGSSTDLWGESWAASDINDADFGVVLNAKKIQGSLNENSLVSTPNGLIKIKDLKAGDEVLSYNETSKNIENRKVENVIHVPISADNNRYFYIYSNGKLIKSSENHKFYIDGNYIRADQLKVGDKLLGIDLKQYPIDKIEIIQNTTDSVWDITVKDNHNFFVNGVLTHNTGYIDHIRITVYYTTP